MPINGMLRPSATTVLRCSSSGTLQSSTALALASGHFLRLAVPALSCSSVRHMCHTCLHTWVTFARHAPSHLHLHHPCCQKCLMANPHLSRSTTNPHCVSHFVCACVWTPLALGNYLIMILLIIVPFHLFRDLIGPRSVLVCAPSCHLAHLHMLLRCQA